MKNKKGDTIAFVLYVLIVFAIIMVLYLVLSGKYDAYLKKFFQKEVCKESVRMHSRLHIGGIEAFSDVNCPVEYKTVEKDDNTKAALAYYMAECWDKYGEGRLKLFSNEWISTEKFCAICTHLKFNKDEIIEAKSFLEYLKEKPAPTGFTSDIFENEGVSYYTYLSGYKTEELDLSNPKLGEYKIDTNKPYGVVFTYAKKGDFFNIFTAEAAAVGAGFFLVKGLPFIGRGGGVIGTIVVGSAGATAGIYGAGKIFGIPQLIDSAVVLIPYDEIELQKLDCEIFPVKPSTKKEK